MKLHYLIFCSLSVCLSLGLCGCSTVTSSTYTRGAIQSAFFDLHGSENPYVTPISPLLGTVQVYPFSESRVYYAADRHNLALSFFPVACICTYWDRNDWMLWSNAEGAYKPVGIDMAEAIRNELYYTGRFQKVLGPYDEGTPDLIVEGDVQKLSLRLRPHLCGVSTFFAGLVGIFGIPLGTWSLEQTVLVQIKSPSTGEVVWNSIISTEAAGNMAAYSGGNPMQFGYPYEGCMRPVIKEVLTHLVDEFEKSPQKTKLRMYKSMNKPLSLRIRPQVFYHTHGMSLLTT